MAVAAPPADAPPGVRPEAPRWAVELLAVVVAAAGPVVRSRNSVESHDLFVAAVAIGAGVLLAVLPARLGPLRLLVPIVAAGALLPAEGVLIAGWTAGALLAADWGVRGRSPVSRRPTAAPARVPVATILLLAAWWGGPEVRRPGLVVGLVTTAVLVALGGLIVAGRRATAA